MQRGFGIVQFAGHDDPQGVKTCPSTGQAACSKKSTSLRIKFSARIYACSGHHSLPQESVTSFPEESKKRALQPPQKLATQVASGRAGHELTVQGSALHCASGMFGGHAVGRSVHGIIKNKIIIIYNIIYL